MTPSQTVEALKSQTLIKTPTIKPQSDAERSAIIAERFDVLSMLTHACINGNARAMICSGPPGLGKSYTVATALEINDPSGETYSYNKGHVRATGLYRALYENRFPGNVIVMDDADFIFTDDTSLGLLKAVCDTTRKRVVSWKTEAKLYDSTGTELLPKSFEFDGAVIFLTNIDFDVMISKNNKFKPHLEAMISRSHYIDLALKTRRDYLIRIIQVVKQGMLEPLSKEAQLEILNYINQNINTIRELSLRMVIKIKDLKEAHPENWKKVANITCLRTKM